jgi:hypothetical protein
MGGIVKSLGGLLGLDNGPDIKGQLQGQNSLNDFGNLLGKYQQDPLQAGSEATNADTGSNYATNQAMNNPMLGQLFGQGGALSNAIGKEQQLQNQGFQLTPQDKEAYGQASGNIARQFGEAENSASQDLASRGLASAPSGAAGALFSGIQGNKNEQLANAQMQIANQRMQNTMQRIGQQQQLMTNLGAQGANAINQQYGRQLQGQQNQYNQGMGNRNFMMDNLMKRIGAQQSQDSNVMQANGMELDNKPSNLLDMAAPAAVGALTGGMSAGLGGLGKSLFGAGGGK